jgi:ribosomal protein S18 acetylase RimI-like enzyme
MAAKLATPLPSGYHLLTGHPTISEYLGLRRNAGGLTPKTELQATVAITGSWYACYITYSGSGSGSLSPSPSSDARDQSHGQAVAMARVIGDGGWYFHIIDVAVLPEHQKKGLGKVLMESLLEKIRTDAPSGAYVNLVASVTGQGLYGRYGFKQTAPRNVGMEIRMEYNEGEGLTDEDWGTKV